MPLTYSSTRLLDHLLGLTDPTESQRIAPAAAAPTLVKIEDPLEPVEFLAELLDEDAPVGRRPTRWMQRNRRTVVEGRRRVQVDARRCCLELAQSLDRRIAVLAIPSDHQCPKCGTKWRLEMRVREERRHG